MKSRVGEVGRLSLWDWSRQGIALMIGLWLMVAVLGQMQDVDVSAVGRGISDVHVVEWLIVLVATMLSFVAVSRYDEVIGNISGHRVPVLTSRRAGYCATAIAQSAGMGLLSGGAARWRIYRATGMPFWRAVWFTGLVAVGFMVSLAALASGAILLTDVAHGFRGIAALVLLVYAGMMLLSVFRVGTVGAYLPPLRATLSLLWLTFLDTGAATVGLWVLMPDGAGISLTDMYAMYLLALGVAMIFGSPFGFGPFEVMLITLLPDVPLEQLLASLAVFRIAYYGMPLAISAYLMTRPVISERIWMPKVRPATGVGQTYLDGVEPLVENARRADANLLRQGDKDLILIETEAAGIMARRSGNSLVGLSNPLGRKELWHAAFEGFDKAARAEHRVPCIYKAGPEFTEVVVRYGWLAQCIGAEAILDPSVFCLSGAGKRELRRKLRQAEKAGVTTEVFERGHLPAGIERVSSTWINEHRGEIGFSIGRFQPEYIKAQRVIGAYLDGELIGFVTMFATRHEVSVDLLRVINAAPDGTAHALVMAAISNLQTQNCRRFSLCAAPMYFPNEANGAADRFLRMLANHVQPALGLYRFKNAFRPQWEAQFMLSPSYLHLGLSVLDVLRLVHEQTGNSTKQNEGQCTQRVISVPDAYPK